MRSSLLALAVGATSALVSAPSVLAAGGQDRMTAVFLVPLDKQSPVTAERFGLTIEDGLAERKGLKVARRIELLGHGASPAAVQARQRVLAAVQEGKKLLTAAKWEEAEKRLGQALKEFDQAAPALEGAAEYCDAVAYLASIGLMKGEADEAKERVREVLAIDDAYRFEGPAFGKSFQVLLKEVQRDGRRSPRVASLKVQTTPAGARVFVDGKLVGLSPAVVERLPAGRHLLRVERAGFVDQGRLVPVSGEEAEVKIGLTATPKYAALEPALQRSTSGLKKGQVANEFFDAAGKLGLERCLLGGVRTEGEQTLLDVVWLDVAARKVLARSGRSFEGDEYGELDREVRRFAVGVASDGAPAAPSRKAKKSSDPLDSRSGMEDWDDDGAGDGRAPSRGDPLEGEQGTGDW